MLCDWPMLTYDMSRAISNMHSSGVCRGKVQGPAGCGNNTGYESFSCSCVWTLNLLGDCFDYIHAIICSWTISSILSSNSEAFASEFGATYIVLYWVYLNLQPNNIYPSSRVKTCRSERLPIRVSTYTSGAFRQIYVTPK